MPMVGAPYSAPEITIYDTPTVTKQSKCPLVYSYCTQRKPRRNYPRMPQKAPGLIFHPRSSGCLNSEPWVRTQDDRPETQSTVTACFLLI